MLKFLLALLSLSFAAFPWPAAAQPAATFAELAERVQTGDRVSVRGADGRTSSGRITAITADTLTIQTERRARRFRAGEVRSIKASGDSVGNGALMGLVVGGILGLAAGMDSQGTLIEVDPALCGLITGGIGAGIGALIDRMLPGETIFRAGGDIAVLPLAAPHAAGARLVVRW